MRSFFWITCVLVLGLLGWGVPAWAGPFDEDEAVTAPTGSQAPAPTPVAAVEAPPLSGSSQEIIDYYARKTPGDPDSAWDQSYQDRLRFDETNTQLRDAEHYWWARSQVQTSPWPMKAYKFVQQVICTVGYSGYKMLRSPVVKNTTAPSLAEVKYGLKGAWDGMNPPN